MTSFTIGQTAPLQLVRTSPLAEMYTLSPFVWRGRLRRYYYTGWNQTAQKAQLLLAAGTDAEHLRKRGIAIPYSDRVMNPKEATIAPVADGTWRLFFEFAENDASKVGIASSPAVSGPWTVLSPIFEARPGRWDGWHLSPGPLRCTDPMRPVMFY